MVPDRKWHDKATRRTWPIEKRAALAFADAENRTPNETATSSSTPSTRGLNTDPRAELAQLFTAGGVGEGPLPLFSATPDLFGACISTYGREFSVQETLLLFGVLLARQAGSHHRRRGCKATAFASQRHSGLPRPRADVELRRIDREAHPQRNISDHAGFREASVADEAFKWERLATNPEIQDAVHQLEDDTLVRGRIMAFDLDPAKLPSRATHSRSRPRAARICSVQRADEG